MSNSFCDWSGEIQSQQDVRARCQVRLTIVWSMKVRVICNAGILIVKVLGIETGSTSLLTATLQILLILVTILHQSGISPLREKFVAVNFEDGC